MDVLILLAFYVVAPLIPLLLIRRNTRFPPRMAILLFVLAPLVGACVMAATREAGSPNPDFSRMPSFVMVAYPFGIFYFGLWIAAVGTVGWRIFRVRPSFKEMKVAHRVWVGVGLGSLIGPVVALVLWSLFSLDPYWPVDKISWILSDPTSSLGLLAQGAVAGALSGGIVAWYLYDEPTSRHLRRGQHRRSFR